MEGITSNAFTNPDGILFMYLMAVTESFRTTVCMSDDMDMTGVEVECSSVCSHLCWYSIVAREIRIVENCFSFSTPE